MASHAQFAKTYPVPIGYIVAEMRNPRLHSALKFKYVSECPVLGGVFFAFHHGMSFSSWGEDINVTVTALQPSLTQIFVYSECSMPTQFIDWGKNTDNATNLFLHL